VNDELRAGHRTFGRNVDAGSCGSRILGAHSGAHLDRAR